MRVGSLPGRDEAIRARIRQLKRRTFIAASLGVVGSGIAFVIGYRQGASEQMDPTADLPTDRWERWAERIGSGDDAALVANADVFMNVVRNRRLSPATRRGVERIVQMLTDRRAGLPEGLLELTRTALENQRDLHEPAAQEWLRKLASLGVK